MVRSGVVPLALLTASALLAALPAQAQNAAEDPNAPVFVPIVDEPSEAPPPPAAFYDILEVAISEPGDGTFVLRGTLAGEPADGTLGTLFFGFTTDAGAIVGGCTFAGAPDTRNIGEPIAPDACVVSGAVVFATYSYETAETAIGATITETWAFTDMCAPAGCLPGDSAPGGDGSVGPNGWNVGVYGLDYPLTGCSRPVCPGGEPAVQTLNGTAVAIGRTLDNATNRTDMFLWTTNLTQAKLDVNASVTSGQARIRLVDGANKTLVDRNVTQTGELIVLIVNAAPGNWSIAVDYVAFAGNLSLTLGELRAQDGPATTRPPVNVTIEDDNTRTGGFPLQEVEETPGPGMPLAILAVGILAIAVRRRLR